MERKTPQQSGEAPVGEADTRAESLVEMVLSEHAEQHVAAPARIEGVVIGALAGLGPSGEPLVDFVGNTEGRPIPARATVATGPDTVGREVALMFEGGDPSRPILLGLIHVPVRAETPPTKAPLEGLEVQADGERMVLSAKREIVIRCGKSSITLTSAGKVLIRGAYLLTRSSGVNRIQGGSVQIN
ncbi:MAG TPA: DUF6484 domain-containing protein [Polyangium sp.]|jgi:hypothetical protein|nr:DUF6484 domain-containing protein [Polyangium sp.]